MARAPAPTSKKDLKARGSWRAKDRPDDLAPAAKVPAMPKGFDAVAKSEWKRVIEVHQAQGTMTELDRAPLIVLCQSWSEWNGLSKSLGKLLEGSQDWKRVYVAREQAYKRCLDLWRAFGMTPADRTRVKVPKGGESSNSKYFGGGGVAGKIGVA